MKPLVRVAVPPPGVVTATSALPAVLAGVYATICVAEFTVKLAAGVPPKVTADAFVKFVPVIVTLVPPAVEPLVGVRLVIVGAATVVTEMAVFAELVGVGAGVELSGAPPNSTI